MLELSDYTFLSRLINTLFSVFFALFFLKQWRKAQSTLTSVSRSDNSNVEGQAQAIVASVSPNNPPITGFLRRTAARAGFAAMAFIFCFDVVGSYLKYHEKFVKIGNVWIGKSLMDYSPTSKQVIIFASFLINLYWSFRILNQVLFASWLRQNYFRNVTESEVKFDSRVGKIAAAFGAVLFVLQIVLEASGMFKAWLPVQVVATVASWLSMLYFLSICRKFYETEEPNCVDYVLVDNLRWSVLSAIMETVALFCLTVGALNGTDSHNTYFKSKFLTDFLTNMWSLGFALNFVLTLYLMYHRLHKEFNSRKTAPPAIADVSTRASNEARNSIRKPTMEGQDLAAPSESKPSNA